MNYNEYNDKRNQDVYEQLLEVFLDEGQLFLTVQVETKEEAEEIIEWMYAADKPMKSELIELAFNNFSVSKQEYEAIQAFKSVMMGDE